MNQSTTIKTTARWIGKIEQSNQLPSIVFIGGVHGNELTGVKAIEEVFDELQKNNIKLNGNFYGLRGNIKAISVNERFIDTDLNRAWTSEKLTEFSNHSQLSEAKEVNELKGILDSLIANTQAPLYFMDLHTTSSESPPFAIIDDTLRNRSLANALPVTKVLGIIERLKGTILGYYGDKGPVSLVFEAGRHDTQSSYERHKAAIYLSLVHTGILDSDDIDFKRHKQLLEKSSKGYPNIVEATHRYALAVGDEFEMKPGFKNFSPLMQGDSIATHNGKELKAEEDFLIFMPLYQKKGEDGFFKVKAIHPFWLQLSGFLRKLKLDKFFYLLPGIEKDPDNPQGYIVDRKVASFKSIEFLHLFGYRRLREFNKLSYMFRRPFDFKGPWD